MTDRSTDSQDGKTGIENQTIFRDEALNYIATPNDVNKMVAVVSTRTWFLIIVFSVLIFMTLSWVFLGSIPITLQGQGILIPKGGVFKTVSSPDGLNSITELTVRAGDLVGKDQVLAVLENPETSKTIAMRTSYIDDLKKKKEEIKAEGAKSIHDKKENHERQKKLIDERLVGNMEHQKRIHASLETEKALLKKGFTKRQSVLEVESQLNALKAEETRSKEQVVQLEKEIQVDQEIWQQKVRDISLKLADEERDLENLKIKLETSKTLRSPAAGRVISVHHKIGDKVPANDPMITISQGDDTQLEGLIYLNPMEGKEVKVGMMVYMIPTHLEKEYVGYIEGQITEVSQYPETARSLMATLQNEDLVKKFVEKSPPISAKIAIKGSGDSNQKSVVEQFKLSPGTWVYGRVVVERRPPIAIIMPEVKRIVGTAS